MRILADTGHFAPARVFGWAILESLARLASSSVRSTGLSPIQAVQVLAEEGYIENEDAQRLRELAKLRSAVAHGDFSVDVSSEHGGLSGQPVKHANIIYRKRNDIASGEPLELKAANGTPFRSSAVANSRRMREGGVEILTQPRHRDCGWFGRNTHKSTARMQCWPVTGCVFT
jgi:hypothetical protein